MRHDWAASHINCWVSAGIRSCKLHSTLVVNTTRYVYNTELHSNRYRHFAPKSNHRSAQMCLSLCPLLSIYLFISLPLILHLYWLVYLPSFFSFSHSSPPPPHSHTHSLPRSPLFLFSIDRSIYPCINLSIYQSIYLYLYLYLSIYNSISLGFFSESIFLSFFFLLPLLENVRLNLKDDPSAYNEMSL